MELSSLFSDDFESVPVSISWRAQGSSWLFCTQQFRAVLCLSPGAFQDTLCPYQECSVLGLQPWAVEKCLIASLALGGESTQQKVQSHWPNFGVARVKLWEGSATGPGHSLCLL